MSLVNCSNRELYELRNTMVKMKARKIRIDSCFKNFGLPLGFDVQIWQNIKNLVISDFTHSM